jgi:hypothetical protein
MERVDDITAIVEREVMARIEGDKIIIEEDTTDQPLYERLERAGILREQMILTYAGEELPGEEESA